MDSDVDLRVYVKCQNMENVNKLKLEIRFAELYLQFLTGDGAFTFTYQGLGNFSLVMSEIDGGSQICVPKARLVVN